MIESKHITLELKANTVKDILKELLSLVKDHPNLTDFQEALAEVQERENAFSTGMGKGLAIPHARTTAVKDTILALGVHRKGIDFGSPDNLPVHLFFLLLSPMTEYSNHLKVMSRIARTMEMDTSVTDLLKCGSPEDIIAVVADH
ncbi:MAG: PTS sugar transporter subunit IIA [Phycisphaeraceae bacterium]|nr:PTS sugar transporter subunit IIA [Phycisphaeraceae bacterium]